MENMKAKISYWFKRKKHDFDKWMLADRSTNIVLMILFATVFAIIILIKQCGEL